MRSTLAILSVLCCSIVLLGLAHAQNPRGVSPSSNTCGILKDAMKEFEQIKPGMSRAEIEKHLDLDGGLQFRNSTRYVYPKCQDIAIKVQIEYKLAAPTDQIGSSRVTLS
jgi:hypothetical protein